MKNKRFRNIETGKVLTAKDYGKLLFEKSWKEQKAAGVILEDSPDYNAPAKLSDDEYITIGYDAPKDNEDFEEIND